VRLLFEPDSVDIVRSWTVLASAGYKRDRVAKPEIKRLWRIDDKPTATSCRWSPQEAVVAVCPRARAV